MRRALLVTASLLGGCGSILGIPSEGQIGCPEPCTVTVSGKTVRAESPTLPLPGVQVRLGQTTVTSGADGSYSFTDLAPGTTLTFTLHFTPTNGDPQGPDLEYVAGVTGMDNLSVDLPMVTAPWLNGAVTDCTPTVQNITGYLLTRSTVIGQVVDASGNPAVLFDRQDVVVFLKNPMTMVDYPNPNPADTDPFPTKICFLEFDSVGGQFKAVDEDHSASGRFIAFRITSDRNTGTGAGHVDIPGYPSTALDLSAGSVGFAKIVKDSGDNLPDRKRSFARDVYHFFRQNPPYLCVNCHHLGGPADLPQVYRTGRDGTTMFPPFWNGSSDDVYSNLTLGGDTTFPTDCDTVPARVCTKKPDASLFFRNPTKMASHSGQDNLSASDPFMVTVLQWITDGALP